MGQDAYGNYQASVFPATAGELIIFGSIGRGSGPPDADTPLFLELYIDGDTGDVYANQDGTASGWFLVTASISGVTGITAYDGDPNGVKTMTGQAICLGSGTTLGAIWIKTSAGTSNNEWTEIIASPNG